ncbi:cation diffusion facilitator family transporter [Halomonas caseinilytica]|uniref:cation diffusion facilitator family transporter n=1 Tax=Halomonas caseinilytica TaxID=438744 RepID=UPI0008492677|nr:cation transporter [Halomonas caseinilytica]
MSSALEQRALRLSILMALLISVLGVIFGLQAGSRSILFDGVFAAIDAVMSLLALVVTRLIAREVSQRFQHGYWHLEPLVAALNGAVLLLLCFYAFLNAVQGLMTGGHELAFGLASLYAVIVAIICFVMAVYQHRLNRHVDSEFVRIDMHSWVMSGLITSALLIAFIVALILQRTSYAYLTSYVDSLLLTILTVAFMPVPIGIMRRAMKEVFLIAPSAIDREVHAAMAPVMQREGLLEYRSHVAKSGRGHFIEIHIVTTPEFAAERGVAELDEIREIITANLSIPAERRWFTVAFTADTRWL